MKGLKKRDAKKVDKKRWEELAEFYDSEASLDILAKGRPVKSKDLRKLAEKTKTKAISLRVPEIDLIALKIIAKHKDRKYQKLIIDAIEKFIDEEEQKIAI